MPESIQEFRDGQSVARAAADAAVNTLNSAIAEFGNATWVLAGGTSPMQAYSILSEDHSTSVDWSKVTVLIGDERLVPFGDDASNWSAITGILLQGTPMSAATTLVPPVELSPEDAAWKYEDDLKTLPRDDQDRPRLDLVWAGMGEDGHTLSLFPRHPSSDPTLRLVIAVYDSPKMPPTRITLTNAALMGAQNLAIFATGAAKKDALDEALRERSLPVAAAADAVIEGGGTVTWMADAGALGVL